MLAARSNPAEHCFPLPLTALELHFVGHVRFRPKRGS
ncbi:hypothetical protein CURTO8I2_220046 [Curtobacterium sp. 8I-2]|nr:hypothetical protein CURTO8I2_220046 [Curtobacterium sp. 8I-2]